MSETVNGEVKALSTKEVNTKRGLSTTYSIRINDDWYSAGFKKPPVEKGDHVTLIHKGDQYKTVLSVTKQGGINTESPNKQTEKKVGAISLDRDRAIIRQNALTNARELYVAKVVGEIGSPEQCSSCAEEIISISRQFEAYTSGDIEKFAAMKKLEEMSDDS